LKDAGSGRLRGSAPMEITLPLSPEEFEGTAGRRVRERTIRSVRLGEITVRHEVGTLPDGTRITPSDLRFIAAPGMTFAYDTIVFVTVLRYVHLMQRAEIQAKILRDHHFKISAGSVSELSLAGLAYLERCHFAAAKRLAQFYRRKCFFIHLDGTNEGGTHVHFVVRDGMSGDTLYAEKISSESAANIIPVLEKVKELFGVPDAVVSDMSSGIKNAVESVFPGVPHKLCHYHFLKAVGNSLLLEKHKPTMISVKRLRDVLSEQRKELVESSAADGGKVGEDRRWLISLIDYLEDYQRDLSGEGFPFDLPALAFYERCEKVFALMDKFMAKGRGLERRLGVIFSFIRNRIQEFLSYAHIGQLKNLNEIFMELRDILHPKTDKERTPLNWGMIESDIQIEDIADKLETLWLKAERKAKSKLAKYLSKAWKCVRSQLKRRRRQLNPVIEVNGRTFILPRTNNLCETGFRDGKRKIRRTTGMRNLSRNMDDLPAQYFYAANLENPEYVKTVFGEGEICDQFHKIDKRDVRKTVEEMKAQRKSPKAIDYKLIRDEDYLQHLERHFSTDSDDGGHSRREDAV
jgi:hypothetical protein